MHDMSMIHYFQVKTGRHRDHDDEEAEKKAKQADDAGQPQFTDDNVPAKHKPYLDRELGFDDYVEILQSRVDEQWTALDAAAFAQIDFENLGHPDVLLRIFAFLAQEPLNQIALKKGRQMLMLQQGAASPTEELDRQLRKRYPDHRLFEPAKRLVKLPGDDESEISKVRDMFAEQENEKTKVAGGINFKQYVNFFKTFCRMPGEHDRVVR